MKTPVRILWIALALCISILTFLTGCATVVDQKIGLNYERMDRSFGSNSGNIVVVRNESSQQKKKNSGEWILGPQNNADGVQQAVLLSQHAPGEWVTEALLLELRKAGLTASELSALPDGLSRGAVLSDISVFLKVNRGAVSDDTWHELKFNVHAYINGARVKTFSIASRGNRTFPFTVSKEELERIMLESMQDAMQQIVPEIITLTDKK
jgi:hypothetical protein